MADVSALWGVGPAGCWRDRAAGHELRQVTATGRVTALPRRPWGLGGQPEAGGGRIWPPAGTPVVPRRQPKRGRLWLTGGSCVRLRPICPSITSGPTGLVGGPNSQAGGPCGCRPWRGEAHPAMPGDRGSPADPGRQLCPIAPRSCLSPMGLPRTRAWTIAPRADRGRAGPGLGRVSVPPAPHPARQHVGGTVTLERAFNGKTPGTSH